LNTLISSKLNKNNLKIIKNVDAWQHIIHFIIHQNSHMVVTNDNTHTMNQRMKPSFFECFFHSQSMSYVIMVACDSSNVNTNILVIYVNCN
jgi:hypothetical protein